MAGHGSLTRSSRSLVAFTVGATLALVAPRAAQDVTPGGAGAAPAEAAQLFPLAAAVGLAITGVTISNGELGLCSGADVAEDTVFGHARGFAGIVGFVISNAYVEAIDNDGFPAGSPGNCYDIGGVPNPGSPSDCAGADLDLFTAVGAGNTDATVYEITFVASNATVLDLTYNLVTHENPADPSFGDAFGIFYDGNLLAGGVTFQGPTPGTDPWALGPSPAAPWEFQSIPATGFHVIPAHETGGRTLTIGVAAGSHTLSFKVADSGPTTAPCPSGAMVSSDRRVHTSLFAGVRTYSTGNPGSVAGGVGIELTGHEAVSGGPFPDDLQVVATNVPIGSVILLLFSGLLGTPFTIPSIAPLELLVSVLPVLQIPTVQVASSALVFFPPTGPPAISPTAAGADFFFQWWGIDPTATLFNSKGLRMQF